MRTWLVVCLLGAIAGLFLGVILSSPSRGALVVGPYFLQILPDPSLYWPYPIFGAAIAVLIFYLTKLLKNSN